MLNELFSFWKQSVRDRVKSPIIRTFVFFLIGLNWRVVLVILMYDGPIQDAFTYIDEELRPTVWWPILATVAFLAAYPWVVTYYYEYQYKAEKRKRAEKIKNDEWYLREKLKIAKIDVEMRAIQSNADFAEEQRRQSLANSERQSEFERDLRKQESIAMRELNKIQANLDAENSNRKQLKELELKHELNKQRAEQQHELKMAQESQSKELERLRLQLEIEKRARPPK